MQMEEYMKSGIFVAFSSKTGWQKYSAWVQTASVMWCLFKKKPYSEPDCETLVFFLLESMLVQFVSDKSNFV